MSDVTLTASLRANLLSLRQTGSLLDTTQQRVATGKKVLSALDGPVEFFTAKGLTDRAGDFAVLKDNMGQAISAIQTADKAITAIAELVEQAKSLAISAKAAATAAEKKTLSGQYNDLRGQIDKLAADASFNGVNLIQGRGIISGGAFLDNTATAVNSLTGVSAGGIARTGTDTNIADYDFLVQQKVNNLQTIITGTTNINASVQGGSGSVSANNDSLEFFINGISVGTAAIADVTAAGSAYATVIDNLSTDFKAEIVSNNLKLTVNEGKVLEIRERVANVSGALLADLGISAGLQNDTTGAQVKSLTSALGIYGAEVFAHVSGYTDDSTSTNVTFTLSGTTLTVKDGTTGSTATIDTSAFATAGTDVLKVGDLNVNFVTSLSNENVNVDPGVAQSVAAVKQVSTATFAGGAASFNDGDIYTITVDGNVFSRTSSGGDQTHIQFATAFFAQHSAAINALNVVVTDGADGVLTFTSDNAGDEFTFSVAEVNDPGANGSVAAATTTANVVQAIEVTITGKVDDGDVYSVVVNGTTVSYTAKSTDSTVTDIANGLKAALNANTTLVNGTAGVIQTVTSAAGVLTISENKKGTVLNITSSATDAAISFGNESKSSSTQDLKNLTAKTATGDIRVKVTSNGVSTTADVDTDATKTVTISNAAFGSTFLFKGNDSAMIAGEKTTVSVTNPTGTGANDLGVTFNVDGSAKINVNAVTATATGLGVATAVGDWATIGNIDTAIAQVDAARDSLRNNARALATNLGVIQTREDFTSEFINALQAGADKLTLADANEEAANILALQTRQQLGIQSLSLASQAAQSVLALFR